MGQSSERSLPDRQTQAVQKREGLGEHRKDRAGGREGMRVCSWEIREGLIKVLGEQMEGGKGVSHAGSACGQRELRVQRACGRSGPDMS